MHRYQIEWKNEVGYVLNEDQIFFDTSPCRPVVNEAGALILLNDLSQVQTIIAPGEWVSINRIEED